VLFISICVCCPVSKLVRSRQPARMRGSESVSRPMYYEPQFGRRRACCVVSRPNLKFKQSGIMPSGSGCASYQTLRAGPPGQASTNRQGVPPPTRGRGGRRLTIFPEAGEGSFGRKVWWKARRHFARLPRADESSKKNVHAPAMAGDFPFVRLRRPDDSDL